MTPLLERLGPVAGALGWTASTTRRTAPAHYVPEQTESRHNGEMYVRTACGRRVNLRRLMAAQAPFAGSVSHCATCRKRAQS